MKLIRKLVLKNLKLNKKRTIVTIVGIILSVALLSALSTLVISFRASLVEHQKVQDGDYHVSFSHITKKQVGELKHNILIEKILLASEMGYAALPESKNEDKPYAYILGMSKESIESLRLQLIEGRLPQNGSEILIPRHLKTNGRVDFKVGDTITLMMGERVENDSDITLDQDCFYRGIGESLRETEEKTYTIVGVIERPGIEPYTAPGYTFITYRNVQADDNNVTAFIRFTPKGIRNFAENLAHIIGCDPEKFALIYDRQDYIHGNVDNSVFVKLSVEIEKSPYKNMNINEYLVQYERLYPMDSTFEVVLIIGCFVAVVIIFTSVYCIKNSFEISVTEKIRQYGMLSGIGATKSQIKQSVFLEAAVMGGIGIPVGLASGLMASFILIKISNNLLAGALSMGLVYRVSIWALLATVILGCITVYLSAISGAGKAARVSPIEAIRNQNEIRIDRKRIRTPFYVSKLFGAGGIIAYKNIGRNRKKYRTSVVSIAICTMTFLIVSYFMSMGFGIVGLHAAEDECNIRAYVKVCPDFDVAKAEFKAIDHVKKVTVIDQGILSIGRDEFTKEYKEAYWGANYEEVSEDIILHYPINTFILDNESFDIYAEECRIKAATGQIILVNYNKDSDIGEIPVFNLKKGDKIQDFTIAGVTDIRPFGQRSFFREGVVMSYETALNAGMMEGENTGFYICFESDDADALQDNLEKYLEAKENIYGGGADIYNRDANTKQTQSLLTLLAIFAYGLITVIALIGVTNIVNTLNTSMELRARDFATLRSIGMTNGQFEKMALLETLFTTIKALFWGTLLGMLGAFGIWKFETEVELVIPFKPPVTAAAMTAAVVFVLVYTIIRFSLARINKRNIIEAIRNENA